MESKPKKEGQSDVATELVLKTGERNCLGGSTPPPSANKSTHGVKLEFGRHSGELLTRIPVSYLKWMVSERTQQWQLAELELNRRGAIRPDVDVTPHAVDRASQQVIDVWKVTQYKDEGLYTWLVRLSVYVLNEIDAPESEPEIRLFMGLKLVFDLTKVKPILKTIVRRVKKPTKSIKKEYETFRGYSMRPVKNFEPIIRDESGEINTGIDGVDWN